MSKKLKHKLAGWFLRCYTRRRDLSHTVSEFKQLQNPDFRNIVIYSTTALGDFLMNTPAIHAVRVRFPDARITVVSSHKMHSYINSGTGKDWDAVIPWNGKIHGVPALVKAINAQGAPDLLLILHSRGPYDYLSAVISGARFIFSCSDTGIPGTERWLTNYLTAFHGHSVQARLDLIAPLGCQFTETSVEMHVPCGVTKTPSDCLRVGFQMGASSEERRWPVHYFVQVALALFALDKKLIIVLFGAPGEIPLGEQFLARLPTQLHHRTELLIGKTSVTELTQAVNNIDALVTGDTGTMHIALALKVPTISLFVSANPCYTGPYQNLEIHQVISGFACPLLMAPGDHEMSAVKAEPVINATIKALTK
ncbi:glycosyltransferase family 9 protein [Morganella psychrotolerans]|uniref:Glycosyltransferase family 9 protein n=1 Tax=Morganella psychrotolerans TaxID=368603 RepID=A0A5M9R9H1_9GAMM|nr:glycosyltransferase family 9 protein [Morganella psychrotolerans]KAA8717390.1 glycosyltransferase family 9 protein [Morganella psychrotolerans]OBU08333.1 ADP-heptose--LPS heptosyltransferase [Morganella psychrotolerans]